MQEEHLHTFILVNCRINVVNHRHLPILMHIRESGVQITAHMLIPILEYQGQGLIVVGVDFFSHSFGILFTIMKLSYFVCRMYEIRLSLCDGEGRIPEISTPTTDTNSYRQSRPTP